MLNNKLPFVVAVSQLVALILLLDIAIASVSELHGEPRLPPCTECMENCGSGSSCGCFGPECACGLPPFACPNGVAAPCQEDCKASCRQETEAPNSRATCLDVTFAEIDAQYRPDAHQNITFPICRTCEWCCWPKQSSSSSPLSSFP
ncbi:hypothetical protein QOT17_003120 [Balamuthia mandrillaris]